tara:strand:+ start:70 stop:744 length:675 start_codon:yes stop_codon:yes gene_type:complete
VFRGYAKKNYRGRISTKNKSLIAVLMVALAGFGAMPAMAQAPLIDTSVVTDNTTDSRTDGAISLKLEVDNDTSVEQLEAFINPVAPTNVRFLIASNGPDAVLFYSAPVAVGAGAQWVQSPAFNFTLLAGQRYEIAAMVEGQAAFPWGLTQLSDNGLTAFPENGNPQNFAAPTNLGESNGVAPHFRIFGSAQAASGPVAVPALPLFALLLLGGLLVLSGMRRLKR